MKTLIPSFAALFLFHSSISAQPTYWIDGTCKVPAQRETNVKKAIEGAINLADRAYNRLQSQTDTDMKGNFQKLFKADYNTDAGARNQVNGKLYVLSNHGPLMSSFLGVLGQGNGIATWRETQDRQQSNVRIYCDNDDPRRPNARWTLAPDPPPESRYAGYKPQAERRTYVRPPRGAPDPAPAPGDEYQDWYDNANGITTVGLGCLQANDPSAGITYTKPINVAQRGDISVITICDIQLNGQLNSFDDIRTQADINSVGGSLPPGVKSNINAFYAMTASVVLHEFCHVSYFRRVDVPVGNGVKAYDWNSCIALSPPLSLLNVQNYVYLALLAKLADRGWRLSRVESQWRNMGLLTHPGSGTGAVTQRLKRWLSWEA
ncbi:MAG: hypothetical protein Q9160_008622 [Pyrenula sp. 1 TL-2023]